MNRRLKLSVIALMLMGISAGGGYWIAYRHLMPTVKPVSSPAPETSIQSAPRKVLYWYDPMVPNQHFDKPGKSPFMGKKLGRYQISHRNYVKAARIV